MHAEGLAGRRVLVVEDESMVTMLLLDLLNEIGCEVAGTASRLGEAMNKALTLAFDVAILDVNLNGEMSFPLANALLARGRPLVFATGYGATSLPTNLQSVPILQKPFLREELVRALCKADVVGTAER